jgi:hypothetical protein
MAHVHDVSGTPHHLGTLEREGGGPGWLGIRGRLVGVVYVALIGRLDCGDGFARVRVLVLEWAGTAASSPGAVYELAVEAVPGAGMALRRLCVNFSLGRHGALSEMAGVHIRRHLISSKYGKNNLYSSRVVFDLSADDEPARLSCRGFGP